MTIMPSFYILLTLQWISKWKGHDCTTVSLREHLNVSSLLCLPKFDCYSMTRRVSLNCLSLQIDRLKKLERHRRSIQCFCQMNFLLALLWKTFTCLLLRVVVDLFYGCMKRTTNWTEPIIWGPNFSHICYCLDLRPSARGSVDLRTVHRRGWLGWAEQHTNGSASRGQIQFTAWTASHSGQGQ